MPGERRCGSLLDDARRPVGERVAVFTEVEPMVDIEIMISTILAMALIGIVLERNERVR
jgi:hypothetical protein